MTDSSSDDDRTVRAEFTDKASGETCTLVMDLDSPPRDAIVRHPGCDLNALLSDDLDRYECSLGCGREGRVGAGWVLSVWEAGQPVPQPTAVAVLTERHDHEQPQALRVFVDETAAQRWAEDAHRSRRHDRPSLTSLAWRRDAGGALFAEIDGDTWYEIETLPVQS